MVELVQRYSKPDLTGVGLDRLAKVLDQSASRPAPSHSVRQRHKMGQRANHLELATQIVADYQAGVSTTRLTATYGLGKSSVLRFLHEAGVTMRKQPLTDAQIAEATGLYVTGVSVAAVAAALNLNPSTIWRTLTARGVEMRPARNRRTAGS